MVHQQMTQQKKQNPSNQELRKKTKVDLQFRISKDLDSASWNLIQFKNLRVNQTKYDKANPGQDYISFTCD